MPPGRETLDAAVAGILGLVERDAYGCVPAPAWCQLFEAFGRLLLPGALAPSLGSLVANDWLRLHQVAPTTAGAFASADAFRADVSEFIGWC